MYENPSQVWVAVGLATLVALASTAALTCYIAGNGITLGAVALATLPVLSCGVAVIAWRGVAWPVVACLGCALVFDLTFATWRITSVSTAGTIAYCVDGICGVRAPLLASLVREGESVRAGIVVNALLGILGPDEARAFAAAAEEEYTRLDARAPPSVNGVLLASTPERVVSMAALPETPEAAPAIVFLHGYGGLLTTYVSALRESRELDGFVIVAPALGVDGAWWSETGLEVLARTLNTLPAGVDRDRVYLVGLSNGAVGLSAALADPGLADRFRAGVALVGVDGSAGAPRVPLLVVAGSEDERFPIAGVEAAARSQGAELVVLPADHFVLFTHTEEVVAEIARWIREHP